MPQNAAQRRRVAPLPIDVVREEDRRARRELPLVPPRKQHSDAQPRYAREEDDRYYACGSNAAVIGSRLPEDAAADARGGKEDRSSAPKLA